MAKEFGWTPEETLGRTVEELRALVEALPRVNCEGAFYTAAAVNDPGKLKEMLEDIMDAKLSERERWVKAMGKARRR
jgi:hypothetical protein